MGHGGLKEDTADKKKNTSEVSIFLSAVSPFESAVA